MKNSKHVGARVILGVALAGLTYAVTLNVLAGPEKSPISKQQDIASDSAKPKAQDCAAEVETLRKQSQRLRAEVDRLKAQVKELEKYKEIDYVRDLLMREEQRGEELQLKLLDVAEKSANLQSRLVAIDQQLSPENIERALAGVGSLRPEETREGARRRLVMERQGLLAQIQLTRQEQTRLQMSLQSADQSIQRLRLRLSEAIRN